MNTDVILKRALATVVACCVLCMPTRGDDPLDPPQGQFADDWMIVELADAKAGYAHTTMTRSGDTITTRALTYFRLGRDTAAIEVSMLQTAVERLDGTPISFDHAMKLGTTEQRVHGRLENGKMHIVSEQYGNQTKRSIDFPANARMLWGLHRETLQHGFTEGTTYEVRVYEPSISTETALTARVEIGGETTIELDGRQRQAIEVATTMAVGAAEIPSIAYVDAQGQVLRGESMMGPIRIAFVLADKQTALADFEPPEFFVDTLIPIDTTIDRDAAKRIKFAMSVAGGGEVPQLPRTGMQEPVGTDGDKRLVQVTRQNHAELARKAESADPVPPQAMSQYLQPSPAINADDDEIKKMAQEAAGNATNPYVIAHNLRVYVSRVIRNKNLNVGFATASEVCRKREGDCTEHAVLLAALGRAKRIPSRVVVGVAYLREFAGKRDVFGFHMWTQFHIAGEWVDFDAALQESDCSPARIALATSSLKDAAIGDIAFPILDCLTGLRIDVVEIETR